MKKSLFKTIKVLLAGLTMTAIAAGMLSCKTGINNTTDEKAYLVPSVTTSAERTIFPDIKVEDLTSISLEYAKAGDSKITYAIWDNFAAFKADDNICLPAGDKYTLVLTAYKEGTKLQSTVTTGILKAGKNEISFVLSVADEGKNNGSARITATFKKTINLKSSYVKFHKLNSKGDVEWSYEKYNPTITSKTDGTQVIELYRESVEPGDYRYELNLMDTDDNVAYISEMVWVYDGCESKKEYSLDDRWVDYYSLASGAYTTSTKHLEVEPDPKGVKITLKYAEGDGTWTNATVTSSRLNLSLAVVNCDENNEGIFEKDADGNDKVDTFGKKVPVRYPTKENPAISYIFPYAEEGEGTVFTLGLWLDRDATDNNLCDYYGEEKTYVVAGGGTKDIFNFTNSNLYNKAKVTLSDESATAYLSDDITTFFKAGILDRDHFDYVSVDFMSRSGKLDWSDTEDAYCNYNWHQVSGWTEAVEIYGLNYKKFLSEDGFTISVENASGDDDKENVKNAINKLKKRETWWVETRLRFVPIDSKLAFQTVAITSDEQTFYLYNAKN